MCKNDECMQIMNERPAMHDAIYKDSHDNYRRVRDIKA